MTGHLELQTDAVTQSSRGSRTGTGLRKSPLGDQGPVHANSFVPFGHVPVALSQAAAPTANRIYVLGSDEPTEELVQVRNVRILPRFDDRATFGMPSGLHEVAPEAHGPLHPADFLVGPWGSPGGEIGAGVFLTQSVAPATSAALTDEAAHYAKDAGLMAIVEEVAEIVTRLFGRQRPRVYLTPVREEGDVPLLCFEILATGTTEQVLDQDEALQEELFDRLPPDERAAFSFLYRHC